MNAKATVMVRTTTPVPALSRGKHDAVCCGCLFCVCMRSSAARRSRMWSAPEPREREFRRVPPVVPCPLFRGARQAVAERDPDDRTRDDEVGDERDGRDRAVLGIDVVAENALLLSAPNHVAQRLEHRADEGDDRALG